ncbi:MAG: hypothetical protein K9M45_11280 [Kiritimatiellales bacterium]|nr:hypothetical protein [Kiritimatiellales bacterium]
MRRTWICIVLLFSMIPAMGFGAMAQEWRSSDDIIDGWDWSLPPDVMPHPSSGIKFPGKDEVKDFPGRQMRDINCSWSTLEPQEGTFDFESLRQEILEYSEGGKYFIGLHLRASVWEMLSFPNETKYPNGWERGAVKQQSAPRWLARYSIPKLTMKKHGLDNIGTPFQIVNLDIYHPEYHKRYLRMLMAFGKSGIPQMDEVNSMYVHLFSGSRGEEGNGPEEDDPNRKFFVERMQGWADACEGVERKLCMVSHQERDLELTMKMGMGQRNGFVEMYMLHCQNKALGQYLDEDDYLCVDESAPLIAENRASLDENEEYTPSIHVARFGPVSTWSHRYRESMLRALQMRRNMLWVENQSRLVDPPLLAYTALSLGKNVTESPDVWCHLRESVVKTKERNEQPVKNFERWLYQRDDGKFKAIATEKVVVQKQKGHHKDHQYDFTARRTDIRKRNDKIGFAMDDRFLKGGPHRVAIKITYYDRDNAKWALAYKGAKGPVKKEIQCGDSGAVKTATFFIGNMMFPTSGKANDFFIQSLEKDAVISFVRLIKL